MGTVVESLDDGGMIEDCTVEIPSTPFSSSKQIENAVMYKLVRVAGDGTLVPATDEEIMEVEDLLENDVNDMNIVTHTGQTADHISEGGLSSGLPQLENIEVVSAIYPGSEASPGKLDSQLECAVEVLQKVDEEDRLCTAHGSEILSPCFDANIQCSNEISKLSSSEDKVQSEALLQESTRSQIGCDANQQLNVEPCLNAVEGPQEATFSTAVQKPDFPTLRGEICLDNLSIKALQETFRATFGRETSVKDKLWLKRRIAMGLLNSCFVSTTCLTIKGNKVIGGQKGNCSSVSDGFSKVMADVPGGLPDHIEGCPSASGDSSRDNFGDHECDSEDFASEHRVAKRLRKPTRRYIEELSETNERQQSGKSTNPSKDRRLSLKSQLKSVRAASSGGRLVVTRMVSLAGSRMHVPFVFQVRRSRPRENIMALVDIHPSCLEAKDNPVENSHSLSPSQLNSDDVNGGLIVKSAFEQVQKEFVTGARNKKGHVKSISTVLEQDMELEQADSSGNSSDGNHVVTPMLKSALRRKHHRAWTLSEVIKLVEGVAKHGAGKWSEIKRLSFASHSYRTSVDLKDKWRNLLRASFAQTPSKRVGSPRKHGSTPIPTAILMRVRELAEKQSLVPPVSKATGEDKGTGFL